MDDLKLHDDDIPEFEFPHLSANRAERYERARKLLEEKKILDDSFKETWLEIIELPETDIPIHDRPHYEIKIINGEFLAIKL